MTTATKCKIFGYVGGTCDKDRMGSPRPYVDDRKPCPVCKGAPRTNPLSTPVEARKAIKNHKGIITIGIQGPIEYDVIITKAEATGVIRQAEVNSLNIQLTNGGDQLSIALWEA